MLNVMTIRREQDGCTGGEYSKSERYGNHICQRFRWTPDTNPGMPAMISGLNGSPTKELNPGLWIRLVSKEKHLTRGVSPHGDKAVVGLVSLGPRGLRPPEQGNHRIDPNDLAWKTVRWPPTCPLGFKRY